MVWFQSPLVWSRKENYSISWELQMPIGVPVAAGTLALLALLALAYHCLKEARRGPAGNPLFRVPCPSVAFSNVPLKALMAPGLLLSFDMKRSPPRCFRAGCGIRQAPCIHMDGEAPMPPGLPPGALLEASQDYKLMFTGVHQTGSPAGRPGINLFCIVGACYFPAHQLATKPFSDFARAEQAQGEDRRNRGPGMEGLYIAQSRVTGDCQPCHP
ncbi:uncharacterized protein LOC110342990 isoform X2 [Mesocricetus auratus]|uniref:Uncharacterized protein LOC110342990 isoform X2 n=1 Tax=Mesocricetus auratus TaxID=10036 RepID=A0ABM2XSN7_MESAU|nr:uncharacterized protein LOC110342990 isoform X2 [Mesocricetus auratus]